MTSKENELMGNLIETIDNSTSNVEISLAKSNLLRLCRDVLRPTPTNAQHEDASAQPSADVNETDFADIPQAVDNKQNTTADMPDEWCRAQKIIDDIFMLQHYEGKIFDDCAIDRLDRMSLCAEYLIKHRADLSQPKGDVE